MQGAQCGTRSWVSRIMPWAEGSAKPLSHRGCPGGLFRTGYRVRHLISSSKQNSGLPVPEWGPSGLRDSPRRLEGALETPISRRPPLTRGQLALLKHALQVLLSRAPRYQLLGRRRPGPDRNTHSLCSFPPVSCTRQHSPCAVFWFNHLGSIKKVTVSKKKHVLRKGLRKESFVERTTQTNLTSVGPETQQSKGDFSPSAGHWWP